MLLYLVREVRAASIEAQSSRYNERDSPITNFAQNWSVNDELSEIVFRGLRDPLALQPVEVFRFYSSVFGFMKAWEATYHYALDRSIHDWGSQGLGITMTSFMALPGMQQYWTARRSWYSQKFQAEVDRIIESSAERIDEVYDA